MNKNTSSLLTLLIVIGIVYLYRNQLAALFSKSAPNIPSFVGAPTPLWGSGLGTPGSYYNGFASVFGPSPGALEASATVYQASSFSDTPYTLTDSNGIPIPGVT
ncbi:MAG TPA: hypothetical protein VFB79_07650 [Candidatus Angelobacter sp.]|nr:hypothetical protein [Candidatus Angelobacter sp.]